MSSVIKTIASIALPIVGMAVAPGIGGLLGSTLSDAALGTIGGALGGTVGGGISSNWDPLSTALGAVSGGTTGYLGNTGNISGISGSGTSAGSTSGALATGSTPVALTSTPIVSNILPSFASAASPSASTSALGSGIASSLANKLSSSQILPALLSAGSNISTQMGVDAAKKSSAAQVEAANKALALTQPYTEAGTNALKQIETINSDPAAYIQNNPLYTSLAADAARRLTATNAASGKLGSGGTADALQERLLQIGNGLVQTQLSNLQNTANAGQTAVGTASNLITGAGDASAAGTVGATNAQTSGYQNQLSTLLALQNLSKAGSYSPSVSLNL